MTTIGRHIINIELFTDAYRVSGRMQVGTGGVLSELNNPDNDYLDLEDAYISRMHEPGKIISSYSEVSFRKDNLNFVVLQNRREGTATGTGQSRAIFARGRPLRVFLTVPAFEIQGEVMYDGQIAPGAILVQTLGHFQPVFQATASAALFPEISYTGDLILVQKASIGIFCLGPNESQA